MQQKLKLYVWDEFSPVFTDGLAFAIAESAEQAMQLVVTQAGLNTDDWGRLQVFDLNTPIAFAVFGGG